MKLDTKTTSRPHQTALLWLSSPMCSRFMWLSAHTTCKRVQGYSCFKKVYLNMLISKEFLHLRLSHSLATIKTKQLYAYGVHGQICFRLFYGLPLGTESTMGSFIAWLTLWRGVNPLWTVWKLRLPKKMTHKYVHFIIHESEQMCVVSSLERENYLSECERRDTLSQAEEGRGSREQHWSICMAGSALIAALGVRWDQMASDMRHPS